MTHAVRRGNLNPVAPQSSDREVRLAIERLRQETVQARGTLTVPAGSTTATVPNRAMTPKAVVIFMPTNAAAGAAAIHVSARHARTFDVECTNPGADRTFAYAVFGAGF